MPRDPILLGRGCDMPADGIRRGELPGDGKPQGRWKQWMRRHERGTRRLAVIVFEELIRTRAIDVAAGLAFWSMMSMVPLLMMLVSLVSLLHLPNLVPEMLAVMSMLVPPSALTMVERMMGALLTPHRGVLSFGVVTYVWSSTTVFTAVISSLNIAYDVQKERTWVRARLRAVLLTFTSGGLLVIALLALVLGPDFAHFLNQVIPVPQALERSWPLIRYGAVFLCFVVALELVYFLAPNRHQKFRTTLPGAVFAIAVAFLGSAGLAFYLDRMGNFSRLYGGMGAVMALMFWIYLIALATLAGGELNAELVKRRDALFGGHSEDCWNTERAAEEVGSEQPASAAGRAAA
ncbi:MAG TPA: YihY/virulence factor BrkB family protein [Acidobacteriaceae bacterium]|jgi:membrane protein